VIGKDAALGRRPVVRGCAAADGGVRAETRGGPNRIALKEAGIGRRFRLFKTFAI